MQPIFTNSKGSVLRQLSDLVKDNQHPFGQHPEDYTLYDLGFWDDNAGIMLTSDPKKIKPPKYYDQFREQDDTDHMEVIKLNRAEHARINNEGLLRNYTKEEIKSRQLDKLMRTL